MSPTHSYSSPFSNADAIKMCRSERDGLSWCASAEFMPCTRSISTWTSMSARHVSWSALIIPHFRLSKRYGCEIMCLFVCVSAECMAMSTLARHVSWSAPHSARCVKGCGFQPWGCVCLCLFWVFLCLCFVFVFRVVLCTRVDAYFFLDVHCHFSHNQ